MLYRITIEPQGPVGTPIRSDTLFGHACWSVMLTEGQANMDAFIEAARAGQPGLVFSDGFPVGYLPRPLLPSKPREPSNLEEARLDKAVKKAKWISAEQAMRSIWTADAALVSEKSYANHPPQRAVLRNIIDRDTGHTPEHGLYSVEETWYDGMWRQIDVYVETGYEKGALNSFLENMVASGYGRDQTVGMGRLAITGGPEPVEFPRQDGSDAFLSLSRCIPDPSIDLKRSWYALEAKYGKAWSVLKADSHFKTGLLQAVPGSVFRTAERKPVYGTVMQEVIPNVPVLENCMTIPVFLPKEVINDADL